jgi:phosphinothricin acetyltransferase
MSHSGRESAFALRAMTPTDWPAVRSIYEAGIASGDATFETTAPDWPAWENAHLAVGRLVATAAGEVIGWAALSAVSSRCVYAGVAEESVYVASTARGQGTGTALLTALVDIAEQAGIWTLQAGIFPENTASIALHQHCGFRIVGRRERLGQMEGRWRDVLLLERRSEVVGR